MDGTKKRCRITDLSWSRTPTDAGAHNNLANALSSTGDFAGAIEHYTRSVELEPDDALAHYNLGILYTDVGQIDEAETRYLRAIELEPGYHDAHHNLGMLLGGIERWEEAIDHLTIAAELDSTDAITYLILGASYVYHATAVGARMDSILAARSRSRGDASDSVRVAPAGLTISLMRIQIQDLMENSIPVLERAKIA